MLRTGSSISDECVRLLDSIIAIRASYAATIGLRLLNVRLAILLIGESAATNLAGLVHCIPAIFDTASIRLRFFNMPWS
jgi:hypothetical protein